MADSKKNSDDESIIDKIVSSINKIDKVDSDEGLNEEEKDNNEKSKDNTSDKDLFLTSKTDEIISNDFKRKFPFLAIVGMVIGIVIILAGIFFILGASERVVDSVASGETGTLAIFIIFMGILILGASVLGILSKKGPILDTFNLDDLKLLDEDDYEDDHESKDNNKSNNKPNNKLNNKPNNKPNNKHKIEVKDSKNQLDDLEHNSNKDSSLDNFDNIEKFKDLDEDGNEIPNESISNDDNNYEILEDNDETFENISKSKDNKLKEDSNEDTEAIEENELNESNDK